MATILGKDKPLIRLVFKNAVELLDEAKILFKNKRYKRAFFLVFTANEELSKIEIHIKESIPISKLNDHNRKTKDLQLEYKRVRDSLNIAEWRKDLRHVQKIRKEIEENPAPDEKYVEAFENYAKIVEKTCSDFCGVLHTGIVRDFRESSLYISGNNLDDLEPEFYYEMYSIFRMYAKDTIVDLKKRFPKTLGGASRR